VKRREFITLLGGAAVAWPLAARAQQPRKLPIIGFLGANTPSVQSHWIAAFVQRLRELGWIEGRNVAIEYRWAETRFERTPEILAKVTTGAAMLVQELRARQCREAVLCLRPRHCGRCDGTYIPKSLSDRYQRQIEAVSFKPRQLGPSNVGTPASTIPMGLRVLAIVLRALFMGALVVVVARVSGPQSETIWSVYETPGDLIRLALGFAMGLWIVIHLFMLPKNAEGYRTWVYLGLVVAPLALAVAIAIW